MFDDFRIPLNYYILATKIYCCIINENMSLINSCCIFQIESISYQLDNIFELYLLNNMQ